MTATTDAIAIVALACNQYSSNGNAAWMGFDVSGASSDAAADNRAVQTLSVSPGQHVGVTLLVGVTAGTNQFQAKYRISTSGTATFSSRRLLVIPL